MFYFYFKQTCYLLHNKMQCMNKTIVKVLVHNVKTMRNEISPSPKIYFFRVIDASICNCKRVACKWIFGRRMEYNTRTIRFYVSLKKINK